MKKLIIEGNHELSGTIKIGGAKNSVVALIPAAMLTDGKCVIYNVPNISDVPRLISMMEALGSKIEYISRNEVIIDNSNITSAIASYELTSKFRASYYLIGSLLGRFDKVQIRLKKVREEYYERFFSINLF